MQSLSLLRKALLAGALALALAILYLLFWPTPIDPVSYTPPQAPSWNNATEPNQALQKAEPALKGKIHGPEDVAVGPDGWIYTGLENGDIVRFRAKTQSNRKPGPDRKHDGPASRDEAEQAEEQEVLTSSRRGPHGPRPLTPPYVRFRIRRFLGIVYSVQSKSAIEISPWLSKYRFGKAKLICLAPEFHHGPR